VALVDKLRPATLLLAVFAAWALALLGLGLMGLGGRFPHAADDPSLAPALPKFTLTKINSRLGAQSDYHEVADRPLMMAERRPVAISAAADTTTDFDAILTSVLITPGLKMAILTDNQGGASHRVRLGENVDGTAWRLVQLNPRQAIFEGPSGQRVMDLRVYNGIGGAPGTPLAAASSNLDENATPPPAPVAPPTAVNNPPPAPSPQAPMVAGVAPTSPEASAQPMTQEQQIDAIRKRIEARRAQARAEEIQEISGQK
jgi:general secretion pathway protein N